MRSFVLSAAILLVGACGQMSQAEMIYNGDLYNGVIFGTGNSNGGFTITRESGVELGLRAKIDRTENFNIVGNGQYQFEPGTSSADPTNARWAFDWSIDTNYDGTSEYTLNDFDVLLSVDFAPSESSGSIASYQFDPVTYSLIPFRPYGWDVAKNSANTVAQNSHNIAHTGFLNLAPILPGNDPNAAGIYTITLSAFDSGTLLASNSIDVYVGVAPEPVPEPASAVLVGMATVGLAYGAARKRKKANAAA